MRVSRSNISIGITGGACICLALSLLVLPLRWILAAVTAGLVHELCHGLAVLLCRGEISMFRLGRSGAVMEIHELPPRKECLCAIAGPLGSGLLVLLFPYFPRVAFCATVHCVYNLLPIYPLDGGRALRCLLSGCTENTKQEVCRILETVTLTLLTLCAFYLSVCRELGIIPLAAAGILWIRAKSGKTPCKEPTLRLQ